MALTDEERRYYSFMVSPAGGEVSFLIIPKANYRPQAAVWEQRGHFEIDMVKRSTAQQWSGKRWPLYSERLFNKVSFINVAHFIDYVRLHDGWDSYDSARAWAKRQMTEVRKYGSRAGFRETTAARRLEDRDKENPVATKRLTKAQMRRQIQDAADGMREGGAYVEIDRGLPSVLVYLGEDDERYFQEWEADELLERYQPTAEEYDLPVEDVILASAFNW